MEFRACAPVSSEEAVSRRCCPVDGRRRSYFALLSGGPVSYMRICALLAAFEWMAPPRERVNPRADWPVVWRRLFSIGLLSSARIAYLATRIGTADRGGSVGAQWSAGHYFCDLRSVRGTCIRAGLE